MNMADERSLFERLDSIESQNAEILRVLSKTENQQPQPVSTQQTNPSNKQLLEQFLRQAKKSWMWFGTTSQFKKAKTLAIISSIVLLVVGFITSIVTSIACRFYSTFTFFENIWMFLGIFSLIYKIKSQRIYEVNQMANNSTQRSTFDGVGMIFFNKEKKKYKVFRWVAIISTVANIIFVFAMTSKFSVPTLIVELLFLAAIIFEYFMNTNLFMMYSIIYVEGHNLTTNERVVLVLPPGEKQLMPEEEFKNKMPILFK